MTVNYLLRSKLFEISFLAIEVRSILCDYKKKRELRPNFKEVIRGAIDFIELAKNGLYLTMPAEKIPAGTYPPTYIPYTTLAYDYALRAWTMTNLYIDNSTVQEEKFEKYAEVLEGILDGKPFSDAYNEVQQFFKGITNAVTLRS